ncbi:tetratricopeptide repeat protein [Flavobacteriaceae bacterium S0825]|uniref:tetratricopeptide repeat protein n=1 Tax=Gaetbulibacter sp. S0825 TaxID=2720084 RepID=UPI00142FA541|nr:tetratricopeptide repeat protein [Gaetbulibacter sp. S0825]MCK0108758.1 tetratricopeptide repeat protein [Flavobacteriaceae bacterium S0825]NIX64394.1 tetratricopeptide repeat protein [Gaetbulibacter sp. S0825]
MKKFLIFLFFPMFGFSQSIVIEINQLFEQKRFIKAEEIASDYAKQNPNNLKAIELLGDAYGHQKKWDEAIEQYKKLVDTDDDNANYHYKYGGALGMKALEVNKFKALGIIGDVKEAFLTAAELDPKHIDTRWALVELYIQLPGIIGGSKKKSLKYADELENLSKVDGYLAKGYIYEYDKEPKLAEIYYKKAIEVGGSLTCYDKLTKLYESEKQPQKAIATIEGAYEKHNKNHLNYQIGKVSSDYNIELDKGERCLKMYIENHSAKDGVPIEWAYYRLAQIQKHRANKQEALKWIDKALDIRSDFKQAKEEKEKILSL